MRFLNLGMPEEEFTQVVADTLVLLGQMGFDFRKQNETCGVDMIMISKSADHTLLHSPEKNATITVARITLCDDVDDNEFEFFASWKNWVEKVEGLVIPQTSCLGLEGPFEEAEIFFTK